MLGKAYVPNLFILEGKRVRCRHCIHRGSAKAAGVFNALNSPGWTHHFLWRSVRVPPFVCDEAVPAECHPAPALQAGTASSVPWGSRFCNNSGGVWHAVSVSLDPVVQHITSCLLASLRLRCWGFLYIEGWMGFPTNALMNSRVLLIWACLDPRYVL